MASSSASLGWHLKIFLKAIAGITCAIVILVALSLAYSTAKGYMAWYFKVPKAVITINGKQTKGWLHKTTDGKAMYFTRADSSKPTTYGLYFIRRGNGGVSSCGTWVASRFPVIGVGDINTPCFFEGSGGHDLTSGPRSVAFIANDGTKLEARW